MEEYEEVPSEYDDSELTVGDALFIGECVIFGCVLITLVFRAIRKTFTNFHLKIGDKVEIGLETKGDKE